jgi:ATP-dependent Lon protease
VGITGEVTLRGRRLPVGGIKPKVPAAHRAGLKKVILPKKNEGDPEDLPGEVFESMAFIAVERADEALEAAFNSKNQNHLDVPLGAIDAQNTEALPEKANAIAA